MLRSAGLWRALLHRSRSDWPVVLAAGMLLLCATTLFAAGAVYSDVVALGGLRRAILDAAPQDRVVVIGSTAAPGDVNAIDEVVTDEATEVLGQGGGEIGYAAISGGFVPAGVGADDQSQLVRFGSYRGIEHHAALVDGAWPAPGSERIESALSEGAAAALGLRVGDTLDLAARDDSGTEVTIDIVGIWRPDRNDPYWLAKTLELDGVETRGPFTTTGPVVVAMSDLLQRLAGRDLDLEWRAIPDVDGLQVGGLNALRVDLESLNARLADDRLPGRSLRVESKLPGILAEVDRRTLVSRGGVLLLTVQFAILAGYAILLVAGMLIERRRVEVALLRSRGAGTMQLAAMAFGEAVMLAIPAALIAPYVAVGVVQLLGNLGPLADAGIASAATVDDDARAVAAAAAGACVIALTIPSLLSGGNPAGVRARLSRQVSRTLPQRLGVDIVLVALAAIGLWQLRLYGSPLTANARGVLGLDPLLIAAPGIGLLAGGILATRLVPRIAEIAERVLSTRTGLVSSIGARQLARRPLRYTRSALLLMLAAALGTFAASDAATWAASQHDQATYQAAADLRMTVSDYNELPSWAVGPAARSIDGVEAAAPIVRAPLDVGRAIRGGQLLAFDPATAPGLINDPTAGSGSAVNSLVARLAEDRPESHSAAIDGNPLRLALVVDAAFTAEPTVVDDDPDTPDPVLPPDWRGIDVTLLLEDADGRLHKVTGGQGLVNGAGQRIEIPLTIDVGGRQVAFPGPARLQGVELSIRMPPEMVGVGSLDILGLEASDSASGDADWRDVGWTPATPGYAWTAIRSGPPRPFRPASQQRLVFGFEPPAAEPIFGGGGATFRTATTPTDPDRIPAVVGRAFLEESGAAVGDDVAASISGQRVTLSILGVTDQFPSLDPRKAFAIVDATTLERARQANTGQVIATKEWWLKADPAAAGSVEAALRQAPIAATQVIGRESLTRSLGSDPVSLGIVGALALGALAALVFASIGFIVSATVTSSERVTEFAILRALGLSARELSAWVSLENAFLLIFGVAAGTVLGIILSWLVLPFATLTETGEAAVPAPEIVVPWAAMAPLYGAAIALFVVTVALVSRQVRRAGISTVLRSGDE
ncbi:MAG TPA: ABC transporter permease [Candidatus Limnocylindrales bacterium]|nr:ABC transporter permease [Candidatus Limnocylindrales bacterium]